MFFDVAARRLKMHSFYLDAELEEALKKLKLERGVPASEAVRRALRIWLEAEGVLKPARPQKGGTQKR